MIRVRHIFVSHPPHEKEQVTIWPSLRSAKNVKKQQEVSDLNQDYHMAPKGKWPWRCKSTGKDSSNELDFEWIGPAVVELQHP